VKPSQAIAGLIVLAALLLALFPPAGFPAGAAPAAGLCLATIGLYATGALPEYVTAILFFLVAMLARIAPADVVFSGFHSTAFWLVFGGLVIGLGVKRTGLAERLARAIAGHLGGGYPLVIGGAVAIGVGLAFLMPSTLSRVLLLLPILLAMADGLGFAPGSNGRAGLVLAASFATMIPAFAILPATVPTMVLIGASETLYGFAPTYGAYLLLHFPVLGLLKSLVIATLVVWLFPDRPSAPPPAPPWEPMSRDAKIMTGLLGGALALWVTDFIHHVSPAWVALAAAVALISPATGIVPIKEFNERIAHNSLFYVAGVLGLGAVIDHAGIGDWLAHAALAVLGLQPGAHGQAFALVAGLGAFIATLATQPSTPAVMTPLSDTLAQAVGLPVSVVLMMQVVGFSTVFLPYQAPPLVVAMQLGEIPMSRGNKLCLALFAATVVVLLPLDYFWWELLGRFSE
jgi:anion transporter